MTQQNFVCPGCTCLCDDIELTDQRSDLTVIHACNKGQEYFNRGVPKDAVHRVNGKPETLANAIDTAAKILQDAKAPLITGLGNLTTQAQQTAWKLADELGATIDTTLTNTGRGSMFSLQRVGKVTASFGEVANRSDLVIFWSTDPATTHPRLIERLVSGSNSPAKIIVVGDSQTETARLADQVIPIEPQCLAAAITTIRAMVAKIEVDHDAVFKSTGTNREVFDSLVQQWITARYGAFIYGQVKTDSAFDLVTDSIALLMRELNHHTRFVSMKLRLDANAQSAENVLAWSSGYPFAINYSQRFPRFHGLEYSTQQILSRGECDGILVATDGPWDVSHFGDTAMKTWNEIPKIIFDPTASVPGDVTFQTRVPGLDGAGEFCRNDDVSLPVQASIEANVRPDANDILEALRSSF